jgi:putative hemolysin
MAEVRELYERTCSAPDAFRLGTLLEQMQVDLQIQPADLERIPAKGPLVAVANHPFGVLGGAALGALLSRVRPDVRVMTNACSAEFELHKHCFFVDPFHTESSAEKI